MTLTIIGAGNIGSAIALGLGSSKTFNASDIYCADIFPEALNKIKKINPDINITTNSIEAVKKANIVIVAVKPWFVETVINEIKGVLDYERQIFISTAAGVEFEKLCTFLKKDNDKLPVLMRLIPNTAIAVKESVNFVSSYNATKEHIDIIKGIFDELGLTVIIDERLMAAGTALASCGIAYAFRYIRAAVEGAVELGLYPELAKKIELQTLRGAITLLETNDSHPEAEIDKVTTPGGITIKGLNAMEEAGFTNTVIKGLKASV